VACRVLDVVVEVRLVDDPLEVVEREIAPRGSPVLSEGHARQEQGLLRPADQVLDRRAFEELAKQERGHVRIGQRPVGHVRRSGFNPFGLSQYRSTWFVCFGASGNTMSAHLYVQITGRPKKVAVEPLPLVLSVVRDEDIDAGRTLQVEVAPDEFVEGRAPGDLLIGEVVARRAELDDPAGRADEVGPEEDHVVVVKVDAADLHHLGPERVRGRFDVDDAEARVVLVVALVRVSLDIAEVIHGSVFREGFARSAQELMLPAISSSEAG
jgi:hypothetical protein